MLPSLSARIDRIRRRVLSAVANGMDGYIQVSPISPDAGFCRINLEARPATLSRSAELEQISAAMAATGERGKVLVECGSPLNLPVDCLADIIHFQRIFEIWEHYRAPATTLLSPPPILTIILQSLDIRFTSV